MTELHEVAPDMPKSFFDNNLFRRTEDGFYRILSLSQDQVDYISDKLDVEEFSDLIKSTFGSSGFSYRLTVVNPVRIDNSQHNHVYYISTLPNYTYDAANLINWGYSLLTSSSMISRSRSRFTWNEDQSRFPNLDILSRLIGINMSNSDTYNLFLLNPFNNYDFIPSIDQSRYACSVINSEIIHKRYYNFDQTKNLI